jgi:DNA transformation protein
MVNSYWQLPARLFDDTEDLSRWARAALASAQRAVVKKKARKSAKTRPAKKKAVKAKAATKTKRKTRKR